MKSIELHLFTHSSNEQNRIYETYNSFKQTFGNIDTFVWYDRNNIDQNYYKELKQNFGHVKLTDSLSDGYIQAIQQSKADYLFMLEHDWIFYPLNINHTLDEIILMMDKLNIYYFRFNKRQNIPAVWDTYMKEHKINNFYYCETNNLSNNPHIINRDFYLNRIIKPGIIKSVPGSKGIEEILNKANQFKAYIYGGNNHPATIEHIGNYKVDFSIIMPVYNNDNYIEDSIKSVINQNFQKWELIIVDDNSTDNTVSIIQQYLTDKRIKLIQNVTNQGVGTSRNIGVAHINSKYFGDLDADDQLLPNAIQIMYNAHLQHSDASMIYSQFNCCDENMNIIKKGFCDILSLNSTNLQQDRVSHFRTYKLSFFNKTSGFHNNIKKAIDKDISFKMEEVGTLIFINKILYLYRQHYKGISQYNNKNLAKEAYEQVKEEAINRRKKKISIIFPYRVSPIYNKLLKWTTQYYKIMFPEGQIIIGEDNSKELFSRAIAINNGVKQAIYNNMIIVDVDILVNKNILEKGITLLDTSAYIIPYNKLHKLNQESTQKILHKKPHYPYDYQIIQDYQHKDQTLAGGIQLIRKSIFNNVGGYDEGFKGWGAEDYAFCINLQKNFSNFITLSDKAIHLWHPEQPSKKEYIKNIYHPNRLKYTEYLNKQNNKTIHLYQSFMHYNKHIENIWKKLPEELRGNIYHQVKDIPIKDYILIAGELEKFFDHMLILVNHGAGQAYQPHNSSSYAGGTGRNQVELFIQPNQYAADLDQQRYPNAAQAVVGCSKLDKWHQRKLENKIKIRDKIPVIAISFHFDCGVCSETRSSFEYYKSQLTMLSYKNQTKEWIVLGHGHPRIIDELRPYYEENNIEVVDDFEEIMERADLYIMDHMSTLYEFASTNRPVVVLNAPWYRKNIEHGLRFWECANIGINVDHPNELEQAVYKALEDPLEQKMLREKALTKVYAYRDGMATERAVQAIIDFINQKEKLSKSNTINITSTNPSYITPQEQMRRRWFGR